jgi:integrator complex subunit 2
LGFKKKMNSFDKILREQGAMDDILASCRLYKLDDDDDIGENESSLASSSSGAGRTDEKVDRFRNREDRNGTQLYYSLPPEPSTAFERASDRDKLALVFADIFNLCSFAKELPTVESRARNERVEAANGSGHVQSTTRQKLSEHHVEMRAAAAIGDSVAASDDLALMHRRRAVSVPRRARSLSANRHSVGRNGIADAVDDDDDDDDDDDVSLSNSGNGERFDDDDDGDNVNDDDGDNDEEGGDHVRDVERQRFVGGGNDRVDCDDGNDAKVSRDDSDASVGTLFDSEILCNDMYSMQLCDIVPPMALALHARGTLELEALVRAMLCHLSARRCALLVSAMAAKLPEMRRDIVRAVLAEAALGGGVELSVHPTLRRVAALSKSAAHGVRTELVDRQLLPELVLELTLELDEPLVFLSSLIACQDVRWMRMCVRAAPPVVRRVRNALRAQLDEASTAATCSLRLARLLRVYCTLIGTLDLRVERAEIEQVLDVVEARGAADRRVLELTLCFVLLCRDLLRHCKMRRVVQALEAIRESGACAESMTLVAIHYHARQVKPIGALVESIVGAKVSLHRDSVSRVGKLFTRHVLSEQQLATADSARSTAPLTCVFALLKSGIYSRHRVDIGASVWQRLGDAAQPVDALLVSLVAEFVRCVVGSGPRKLLAAADDGRAFLMQPFDWRAQIAPLLVPDSAAQRSPTAASQLLMLYYVLEFNRVASEEAVRDANARTGVGAAIGRAAPIDSARIDALPVKRLLARASDDDNYRVLYAPLLKLARSRFAYLFSVEVMLGERERASTTASGAPPLMGSTDAVARSVNECVRALGESAERPTRAWCALRELQRLDVAALEQRRADALLGALLSALLGDEGGGEEEPPRALLVGFRALWLRWFAAAPWALALATANRLRASKAPLSHRELVNDPLLLMQCRRRVLALPSLLAVLLHIVELYMGASRRELTARADAIAHADERKREQVATLLHAQSSALVQLLLDASLGDARGAEQRALICAFVHRQFIETPLLIKIVHFQTYDAALIPMLVDGVDSMHVCLDFLPELLAQPRRRKRAFAVQLAARLVARYPVAKSLQLAVAVVEHMRTVPCSTPDGARFLLATLPSMATLCGAFPPLRRRIVIDFLLDLQHRLSALLPASPLSSLHAPSSSESLALSSSSPSPTKSKSMVYCVDVDRLLALVRQTFASIVQ